jgi:crotonobetainyl-CoA:carnitine CoA-transferase CaiB-like acyl-CoA transferase
MLAGLRIVDLTTVVMGPWATHVLAAYGADVIKVEPPEGDIMRYASAARHPGMGAIYLHGNRGKRSVVLDLKRDAGRRALLRLCAGADVFVHNVRRGAMERLELGHSAVAAANPRLVYVTLCGYGPGGPYAGRPAYDDLIQGASGLAQLFERAGEARPRYVPALIGDRIGGLAAVNAILAALYARERSGRGGELVVPMFETLVELVLSDHLGGESFVPAKGPAGYERALAANRRPYRTADGYVCLLLYTEAHWERFFALVGREAEYRADPRLSDRATRAAHFDQAYGIVAAILERRPTGEWLAALGAADLPAMPLGDVATLAADPHLNASGFIGQATHPSEGTIRTLGVPVRHDGFPAPELRHAPRLGEQSREILREAGYPDAEIDALVAAGVTREAN